MLSPNVLSALKLSWAFNILMLAQIVLPQVFLSWLVPAACFKLAKKAADSTMFQVVRDSGLDKYYTSLGWCTAAIDIFLGLAWLAPLAYCFLLGHGLIRRRYLFPAPAYPHQLRDLNGSGGRWPCNDCGVYHRGRIYYCEQIDRCLPLFDHFCYWWFGPVFLDSIKPYVLFMTILPVHQIFCLVMTIVVACDKQLREAKATPWILLLEAPFLLYTLVLSVSKWWQLVFINGLYAEGSDVRGHPWYMGWRANLRNSMGPWWAWLSFWKSTPAMDSFYNGYDSQSQSPPSAAAASSSSIPASLMKIKSPVLSAAVSVSSLVPPPLTFSGASIWSVPPLEEVFFGRRQRLHGTDEGVRTGTERLGSLEVT